MTPDELARGGSEHAHQTALFAWANCAALYGFAWAGQPEAYDHRTRDALRGRYGNHYQIPQLTRLFAIHNQGHGDKVRGARAKAEGVKKGVPDVMLPVIIDGHAGLFIELKIKREKDTSAAQNEWADYLNNAGYVCKVAVGWVAASHHVANYLWPLVPGPARLQI